MALEQKIYDDYKEAMKARDALKSSVLSLLRAEVLNTAVAKKKSSLDDAEVIAVVKKQIKQRQDSVEQFTRGARPEMAKKEQQEMDILKNYLPPEMPVDELKKIIAAVIAETGAQGMKDMGKVMKEVGVRVAGQADSRTVSDLVRQSLQAG
jgi:hypothetical protein